MRRTLAATLVVGLLLAGCGNDDQEAATTSTSSTSTTASTTTTTTTTTPAVRCSATGLDPDLPTDASLPSAVDAMRRDIARAAAACDWDALAGLVDRGGEGVRASFGETPDPIAFWKDGEAGTADPKPLRALHVLLGMPGTRTDAGEGHVQWVWPPAFASEQPTDAQLQQVADTGLYTMDQLREWRSSGVNYLGYRVLITEAGDWSAFVEGD